MTTEPTEVYCQHGHQMSPGDLLARYCHGCLWAEIARLTAEVERLQAIADSESRLWGPDYAEVPGE